jgi:P-type Ca2+ transporter type 2C
MSTPLNENGLSSEQAKKLQEEHGRNELTPQKKQSFFFKILQVLREPMFVLLIAAAVIYFFLGEPRDGAVMLIFVVAIISIETVQEWKTDKTLSALRSLSAPHIRVIRDGVEKKVNSADLVPGDLMLISEGVKIPADGVIVRANDLCVDESSLTGEPEGVWKTAEATGPAEKEYWRRDYVYAGTLVTQGSALVRVQQIGAKTEYGKIGKDVAEAPDRPTPLEKQTAKLVKYAAMIAAVLFVLVCLITFFNLQQGILQDRIVQSILSGITLAMAMIPEEFPVVLAVFLSMGAWRLAKKHSLVRKLPSVETLGAVSVLCVDKTGTITMNQMMVQDTWLACGSGDQLAEIMGLACESETYDPMEKAMLSYCEGLEIHEEHLFGGELKVEYPFTNETKIMGHLWEHEGGLILAAKGSPESLFALCDLPDDRLREAEAAVAQMSGQGLRVIAIAKREFAQGEEMPASLPASRLTLCGLVGLADPPRDSVREDIEQCVKAGIRVVMITGDNGITAGAIAKKIGMPGCDRIITGKELNSMTDEELRERVRDVSIFSRVIPEHKMRIVRAFRDNGEVVAMTGDGVNDAPALKYADIGIAMGKRGSEVSREAADLVLLDDNFSTIVQTIQDGRRIYDNIRKAVGYIFTIHIPIALACLLAPLLGIGPELLMLLPLHVVLLELFIDPTCSIVLERQPAESGIMERPPRRPDEPLLNLGLVLKSVLQGLAVFAASFGAYYWILTVMGNAELARTMGIAIILLCNLMLVLVNSSSADSALHSVRFLAKDKVMWGVVLGTLAVLLCILYTPLNDFMKLQPLSAGYLALCFGISFVAVFWFELVKLIQKAQARTKNK